MHCTAKTKPPYVICSIRSEIKAARERNPGLWPQRAAVRYFVLRRESRAVIGIVWRDHFKPREWFALGLGATFKLGPYLTRRAAMALLYEQTGGNKNV